MPTETNRNSQNQAFASLKVKLPYKNKNAVQRIVVRYTAFIERCENMDTTMIVVLLVGLIQIILILSVVHISGKVDEICKEMKDMNENLKKIISNTKKD